MNMGVGQDRGGSPGQLTTSASVTPSGFSTIPLGVFPPSTLASSSSTASLNGSGPSRIGQAIGIALGLFLGGLLIFLFVHWTGRIRTWTYLNRAARRAEEVERARKARESVQPMIDGQNSLICIPYIEALNEARQSPLIPPSSIHTEYAVAIETGDGTYEERRTVNTSPPTYAQSQSSRSGHERTSLSQLYGFGHARSEIILPQKSTQDADMAFMSSQTDGAAIIGPQTTEYTGVPFMSRQLTGEPAHLLPHYTRQSVDTMELSSPMELDSQDTPLRPPPVAYISAPRDSLESVIRRGLAPTDSPEPLERYPSGRFPNSHYADIQRNPSQERYPSRLAWTASSKMSAGSSVLGTRSQGRTSRPPNSANNAGRKVSQRTVASDSTMGVDVVSNEELERLGVGSKTWHGR